MESIVGANRSHYETPHEPRPPLPALCRHCLQAIQTHTPGNQATSNGIRHNRRPPANTAGKPTDAARHRLEIFRQPPRTRNHKRLENLFTFATSAVRQSQTGRSGLRNAPFQAPKTQESQQLAHQQVAQQDARRQQYFTKPHAMAGHPRCQTARNGEQTSYICDRFNANKAIRQHRTLYSLQV